MKSRYCVKGLRYFCALLSFGVMALAQSGVITTIAGTTPAGGTPQRGFSGDNGSALDATLALANLQNTCDPIRYEQTSHLAVDAAGNVYVADSENQRIRQITPAGVITTVAGSGEKTSTTPGCVPAGPIGDNGPASAARFYNPGGIAVSATGDLVIADQQNNRIRQVRNGSITTIVGSGTHNLYVPNAPATASPLDWPSAVAFGPGNVLYFAELHGNRVAKIGPNNTIVTVAGTGFPGYDGDNKAATSAQLRSPTGIAVDAVGNVYIADELNHRIRKVSASGIITTLAGNGQAGYSGDNGPAASAALNTPMAVAVDARGDVYIADTLNHRVRKVNAASGIITTVAGDGRPGRGVDNVDPTASSLFYPAGLAVDAANTLYILDWQNFLIRKISAAAAPTVSAGGIANAASYATSPQAPGSLISIFGTGLGASAPVQASTLPLPVSLGGTQVLINGREAPVFYVSAGQVNAQLPANLPSGAATVQVKTTAGVSALQSLTIGAAAPGIFTYGAENRAVAVNQGGLVNSRENPASPGSVLTVYFTGIGPVTVPVGDGQAAPTDPLAYASLSCSATLGGVEALVQFCGLSPGFVGLAQANIQIPASTPASAGASLVLTIAGQGSNSALVAIR